MAARPYPQWPRRSYGGPSRRIKIGGRVWNESFAATEAPFTARWEGDSAAIAWAEYNITMLRASWMFVQGPNKVYSVVASPAEWLRFLAAASKGTFVNERWLR